MKSIKNGLAIIFLFILFSLIVGCGLKPSNNEKNEVDMKNYYTMEDFEPISIGDSSYKDVYEIAPVESMQITSYGGFCEYPAKNGGCIRIKFQGEDLIVISIEEVHNSMCTGDSSVC